MSTKTTFTMNSETISNGFQKFFSAIQESKLKISSKKGTEYINLPLIFALIIAIVFPLSLVGLVICSLLLSVSIEREIKDEVKRLDV